METLVLTLLQLILSLLPQIGVNSSAVTRILAALIQIVPIATQVGGSVVASIRSIITALQSNADLTDEQLETLSSLSAELDAHYDDSLAAYLASKKGTVSEKSTAPAAVRTSQVTGQGQ